MAILSDIEDRLLAMCEGDPVTVKLAQEILGVWYERKIKYSEVVRIVNRLAKLEFAKWQYQRGAKKYFSKKLLTTRSGIRSLTFEATKTGEFYLARPREVT